MIFYWSLRTWTCYSWGTDRAVSMLKDLGFIVSVPPKSCITPTNDIPWLGLDLCSTPIILVPKRILALIAALTIFAFTKRGPSKILRTVSGLISWCNHHSRLGFPFLPFAQEAASMDKKYMSRQAFYHMFTALHATSIPMAHTPIKWGLDLDCKWLFNPSFVLKHPLQDLPFDHYFLFCDASIEDWRFGLVLVDSFPFLGPPPPPPPHYLSTAGCIPVCSQGWTGQVCSCMFTFYCYYRF